MTPSRPQLHGVRFGAFQFDPKSKELRKHGIKIRLHGQPVEILELLLERPGEVITRDELQKKLWSADTFVDFEHGVNAAIKRLRAALDDEAEDPRFIETLPRVGYRFMAQVDGLSDAAARVSPPAPTDSFTRRAISVLVDAVMDAHRARTRWRVRAVVGLATAGALAALLVGFNVRGWRYRVLGHPSAAKIHSIAVLPLENLSGEPEQEYFAAGMTDSLITELGRISALRVISRLSVMRYKGSNKASREIAHDLDVDALVEGSVHRSGDRVRVVVNLLNASTDQNVWAEIYDRDLRDIRTVQSDFAQAIAQQIRIKLTPQEERSLARQRQVDPEAFLLYVKGRYLAGRLDEASARKSITYFEQAIQRDPRYAEAYAGLSEGYGRLASMGAVPAEEGYSRMRAAAERALEMDPLLAEAHSALGSYELYYAWDGAAAEREFQRAIKLNPSDPDGHQRYADYLAQLGRFNEAVLEIKRATQVDPLSSAITADLAQVHFCARHYDEAIEQHKRTLELDPAASGSHGAIALALLMKGQIQEAVAALEKTQTQAPGRNQTLLELGYAYALAGRTKQANTILEQSQERLETGSAYQIAAIYVGLGEKEHALAWLERAYQQRSSFLRWLKVDPRFDPLRSEPRFLELLRRIGLPP